MLIQSYRKKSQYSAAEEIAAEIQEISEEELQNSLGDEISEEIKSLTSLDDEKVDDLMFSDDELDIED